MSLKSNKRLSHGLLVNWGSGRFESFSNDEKTMQTFKRIKLLWLLMIHRCRTCPWTHLRDILNTQRAAWSWAQIRQQHVLPVRAVGNQAKVGKRLLRRTDFAFDACQEVACNELERKVNKLITADEFIACTHEKQTSSRDLTLLSAISLVFKTGAQRSRAGDINK